MLKYTTGELAKLCNVSVRTVQFYDTKNLLKPSEISEGGRRLYTEADVKKLSFICLLKTLGLNLEAIKQILEHADSNDIILSILDEQLKQLKLDIDEKQNQIQTIKLVQQNIHQSRTISFQSIQDIEHIRKGQKKLRTVHLFMLGIGMIMSSIEIVSITLWTVTGNWIPFAVGMPIVILLGCLLTYTIKALLLFAQHAVQYLNQNSKNSFLQCTHLEQPISLVHNAARRIIV